MNDFEYTDEDDDVMYVAARPSKALVHINEEGVYIPADKAIEAAQAILEAAGVEAVVVPGRLPGTRVVEQRLGTYIEVDGGVPARWNVKEDAEEARKAGLDYLAAAQGLDAYNAADRTNKLRLDGYASVYAGRAFDLCERSIQVMLERISELEAEVAK